MKASDKVWICLPNSAGDGPEIGSGHIVAIMESKELNTQFVYCVSVEVGCFDVHRNDKGELWVIENEIHPKE